MALWKQEQNHGALKISSRKNVKRDISPQLEQNEIAKYSGGTTRISGLWCPVEFPRDPMSIGKSHLSDEQETTRVPSGEKTMLKTGPWWPSKTINSLLRLSNSWTSQMTTRPSWAPVAISSWFSEKAHAHMCPSWGPWGWSGLWGKWHEVKHAEQPAYGNQHLSKRSSQTASSTQYLTSSTSQRASDAPHLTTNISQKIPHDQSLEIKRPHQALTWESLHSDAVWIIAVSSGTDLRELAVSARQHHSDAVSSWNPRVQSLRV